MNTVKSFWLGWGSLCVAGAGAYVFAKKQINAERQTKMEQHRQRQAQNRSMEDGYPTTSNGSGPAIVDTAGSPSQEMSGDPAPTRHAPSTEQERVNEKSKFESSTPYRSRKGDRFS